jgi:nitrate reductase beta subunit
VFVLDLELEVFQDQVEVVIDPAKNMIVDNGAKKGNPADLLEDHLHDPRMIADLPLRSSAAVTYRLFAMEWDLLLPWTYGQGEEEKRIGP